MDVEMKNPADLFRFLRESVGPDGKKFDYQAFRRGPKSFRDLIDAVINPQTKREMRPFRAIEDGDNSRARFFVKNVKAFITWRNMQLFAIWKRYDNGMYAGGFPESAVLSETLADLESTIHGLFRCLVEEDLLELVDAVRLLEALHQYGTETQLIELPEGGFSVPDPKLPVRPSLTSGILRPIPDARHGTLGDIPFTLTPLTGAKLMLPRESRAYIGTVTHNITSFYWLDFQSDEMPWPMGFEVRDLKARIMNQWGPRSNELQIMIEQAQALKEAAERRIIF